MYSMIIWTLKHVYRTYKLYNKQLAVDGLTTNFAPKSSFFAPKFEEGILPQYGIFFSYNGAILGKFCHGIMLFLCPIYDPIPGTYFSPISHLFILLTFQVNDFLVIMSCHNVVFTQLIV